MFLGLIIFRQKKNVYSIYDMLDTGGEKKDELISDSSIDLNAPVWANQQELVYY